MYSLWYLVAVVALLARTLDAANIIPISERCVTAVYTALNYISFVGEPTAGLWQTTCQNRLKVTSIYAASEVYCREDEILAGFTRLNNLCCDTANIELLSKHSVADNLTDERLRQMKIVDFQEVLRGELLDFPVLLSPTYYDRTFRTVVSTTQTSAS